MSLNLPVPVHVSIHTMHHWEVRAQALQDEDCNGGGTRQLCRKARGVQLPMQLCEEVCEALSLSLSLCASDIGPLTGCYALPLTGCSVQAVPQTNAAMGCTIKAWTPQSQL